ncbi:MAG: hypothetical protein AABX05_00165 [Nanoarchaeota archaeon]
MAKFKPKTYVITSAQYDGIAHKEFFAALQTYCRERDAELLILPMAGKNIQEEDLDPIIAAHEGLTYLEKDRRLNDKIKISSYNIRPQQIDPVTGLGRFTQSDVTTLFASPKQRLRVIPNSAETLPKVLMTTGAVTKPNYKGDRIGNIALKDHMYGAIVVEAVDPTTYHYRQLIANKQNGQFVDLGGKYKSDGTESCDLEALVLGDWHTGDTNPKVREATYQMIRKLKPKRIFLHDFFNGHSVSHWEENKHISRAIAYAQGRASLEEELRANSRELFLLRRVAGENAEIVRVKGNHDEFLDRYLEEERYMREVHNWRVGHELALACYDPQNPKRRIKDPLQEGLKLYGGIPDKVTFLQRNQDYKFLGWQLGAHGDKGGNGARASVLSLENAYGKSITGHRHTPEILRGAVVVGTSTHLTLPYTDGPSSWMNTHALLWSNGKVQLINIIDGEWRKQ